jgi:hypothetical protein
MALPTLNATFASAADVPRRYMLSQWLVNELGSGAIADYVTLPERYLWAKIAVAAGAPLDEASYISLPKQYVWKAIYDSVSGSSLGTIDWSEKQALGHIAAAYRGDTANPANLATYINWPWRYQVASIIIHTATDSDVLAFIAASGATDIEGLDAFVKGVKNLGLWESMVAWPLRSSQNAGTGTTAYSLGGLGTFNGTLVNGPTWGADGVEFSNATSTHIVATIPQALPATWMTAVNFASQVFRSIYSHDNGTAFFQGSANIAPESSGNTWYFQAVNNLAQATQATRSEVLGSMEWASFSVRANPDTSLVRLNSSTTTMTVTGTIPTLQRLFLGRRSDGLYANMTMPFFGLISGYQDTDAIRSLYKTTIGAGLSLP